MTQAYTISALAISDAKASRIRSAMVLARLDEIGPWTVYADRRIAHELSFAELDLLGQAVFLRGERSWDASVNRSPGSRAAMKGLLALLADHGMECDIRKGVAHVSDPRFQPLDERTMATCLEHRLVDPADAECGLWRLRDTHRLWFKRAVALPPYRWHFDVPLVETEFIGVNARFAVVARLDVVTYQRYNPIRRNRGSLRGDLSSLSGKRLCDMDRPRWDLRAERVSKSVAEAVANMERHEASLAEGMDPIEEILFELELEKARDQAELDLENGYFDDL